MRHIALILICSINVGFSSKHLKLFVIFNIKYESFKTSLSKCLRPRAKSIPTDQTQIKSRCFVSISLQIEDGILECYIVKEAKDAMQVQFEAVLFLKHFIQQLQYV